MRIFRVLVMTAFIGRAGFAFADVPDLEHLQCPVPGTSVPIEFHHVHEVPVVAEDSPTAQVSDVLTVVGRDERVLCFGLFTLARNYHGCAVMGVARALSAAKFVFRDREIVIQIEFVDATHVRVAPVGDGYKEGNCGTNGVIEPATYTVASSEASRSPR